MTRLLNLAGVYLGDEADILSARGETGKAHWEHQRICDINERILNGLGGRWDDPPVWVDFPKIRKLVDEASALVTRTFGGQSVWRWKDP